MMTIQAWIYYIIAAAFATIFFSALGFFLYWQHSKKITIESPKLWGLAYTVVLQMFSLTVVGFLLSEGDALSKWKTSLLFSAAMTVIAAGAYWLLTLYLPFTRVLPTAETKDRIAIKMKDVLKKFSKISGVRAVCFAGRDGFMVDSIVKSDEDAEMISAFASGGFRVTETMGKQLEMGKLNVSMIEYEKGPVILAHVGDDTFLVIVAKKGSNIGMIRLAILKHQIRLALAITAVV
ncbi:MAG: roadblock/LC7 domain-containing protein [Thermodesulfovibrionia bacterium]|nr:roadblock/LC7 domain-containing protein [Thermodesulfovibrionia bacterium]MCK5426107.1 roadblock/LC7 domain-containing protein [Thermodesulfovibrionia bacterium]